MQNISENQWSSIIENKREQHFMKRQQKKKEREYISKLLLNRDQLIYDSPTRNFDRGIAEINH